MYLHHTTITMYYLLVFFVTQIRTKVPYVQQQHKHQHHILSTTKHLTQDMMRLGNIDSVLEPVNFFHGKVGQPFIGDYVNNITSQPGNPRNARNAVVPPDFQATNDPTGRQVVNASGATRFASAIFEVKHITSAPEDITTTTKTLTHQIDVHER